ncbi:hypothetical protein E2562_019656 [Oryza meyeriana var. granulata]|uniref:Uncharacterized protein n=1 Tax=Oryza meyeriana var. granulata TaxID=110450 RepID=A0A6G1C989_9ORYZ|nr:hypothetical protein E2562_019656 [Oryza meyeriana var. granulata]
MADQTLGAVGSLLGVLGNVIKDEASLLSGVEGDIQFIKDEMDSMNGFLMHVTKKTPHDDQLRAWMKQVRDITYVADDCIKLYMRYLTPSEGRIHELKDRVREVGERRHRYDVKLPDGEVVESPPVSQDSKAKEKRDEFLAALEDGQPPFHDAMLLRSLYAHRYGTKELASLSKKIEEGEDVPKEVMLFCYSKLSVHYKSCLQYLTAFEKEESISRTCLVRRWLAEGLVAGDERQVLEDGHSMEEAGERCFDELVFRGFLSPAPGHHFPRTGGLKLKCCVLDDSVKKFINEMSKRENFVDELPTHLRHQITFRKMARRQPPPEQRKPWWPSSSSVCGILILMKKKAPTASDAGGNNDQLLLQLRHPMDEIVTLLKSLPPEYRLNVLDLGGCLGLTTGHLKSICKRVAWLKYLSVRKTNVSRLPKEMNKLLNLETLDIRQTKVQGDAMRFIFLNELKHLLAGNIITDAAADNEAAAYRLSTVLMPPKIGKKTEILRHVEIKDGRARAAHDQLLNVASLERLRKLGVVVDGRQENIELLLTTIARRCDSLRSLSVWITAPPPEHSGSVFVTLDTKGNTGDGAPPPLFSLPSELESLNLKCFKGRNNNTGYIPPWIIKRLNKLSKITLHHSLLNEEGLRELGKKASLRCLKLRRESYIKPELTLTEEDFKDLRVLVLDQVSAMMTKLVFKEGATPKLEKIVWNFDTATTPMGITVNNIHGIKNLKNLKELVINGVNISIPSPSSRSREWKDITTVTRKLMGHIFGQIVEGLASQG